MTRNVFAIANNLVVAPDSTKMLLRHGRLELTLVVNTAVGVNLDLRRLAQFLGDWHDFGFLVIQLMQSAHF